MTSPINFGGGVGTQPVIQNPSIGESFAPLLQALQQQQAMEQQKQAAAQSQANAEENQRLQSIKLFIDGVNNDPNFIDTDTAVELADMGGIQGSVPQLQQQRKERGDRFAESMLSIRDDFEKNGATPDQMVRFNIMMADAIGSGGEFNAQLVDSTMDSLLEDDKLILETAIKRQEIDLNQLAVTQALRDLQRDETNELAAAVLNQHMKLFGRDATQEDVDAGDALEVGQFIPFPLPPKVIFEVWKQAKLDKMDSESPINMFKSLLLMELGRKNPFDLTGGRIQANETAFQNAIDLLRPMFPESAAQFEANRPEGMVSFSQATDMVASVMARWRIASAKDGRPSRERNILMFPGVGQGDDESRKFKDEDELKNALRTWLVQQFQDEKLGGLRPDQLLNDEDVARIMKFEFDKFGMQ